jgi:hypothetical protein
LTTRSPTPPTTATAPATAATSTASGCTRCSRSTALPGRWRRPRRTVDEKDVCLQLVARCARLPGQLLTLIGDKNFRGKQCETDLAELDASIHRPRRKDEPAKRLHLAPIRQRIESISWTAKDILTLERHGARTLHRLRTRLACRFLALAAAVALNHRLGLPSRSLAQYIA